MGSGGRSEGETTQGRKEGPPCNCVGIDSTPILAGKGAWEARGRGFPGQPVTSLGPRGQCWLPAAGRCPVTATRRPCRSFCPADADCEPGPRGGHRTHGTFCIFQMLPICFQIPRPSPAPGPQTLGRCPAGLRRDKNTPYPLGESGDWETPCPPKAPEGQWHCLPPDGLGSA